MTPARLPHPSRLPLPILLARRPAAALLLLAGLGACAPQRPPAAPTPVPVVTAALAGEVLGPLRARPAQRAATSTRAAADATAAPRYAHTPGVTWDLDVLPYEGHARVQRYVALFTGNARGRFTEWLSRGTRYDALVKAKLRAGGLPEDLYYLALVESGYEPNAVSHAGAVGMWQFMAETARDVGLRVDWWVDERRDPVRATDAAVRMMRWLRGQFGSLFVAAAAYNGGPGRVSRGIARLAVNDANAAAAAASAAALAAFDSASLTPNGSADAAGPAPNAPSPASPAAAPAPATGDARFFALADAGVLRSETVNYVPQLIAAALVAKEADRHGLQVRRLDPLAYDTVRVPALTPLAAVAEVTGSTRAELLDLNPHLLRGLTPPGASTVVRVPEGAGDGAADDLAAMDADERRPFRRVVSRRRDTWAGLAERAGVSAAVLRAYNPRLETVARGKDRGRIVGNQAVRVPTDAVQAYARNGSWEGTASGPLPSMPAPPPEPAPKAKPKASVKGGPKGEAKPEPKGEAKPEPKGEAAGELKAVSSDRPKARADSAAAPDSALHRAPRASTKGDAASAGAAAKPARGRDTSGEARPRSAASDAWPKAAKSDAARGKSARGERTRSERTRGDAPKRPAKPTREAPRGKAKTS